MIRRADEEGIRGGELILASTPKPSARHVALDERAALVTGALGSGA
jgi:hypothetical protein